MQNVIAKVCCYYYWTNSRISIFFFIHFHSSKNRLSSCSKHRNDSSVHKRSSLWIYFLKLVIRKSCFRFGCICKKCLLQRKKTVKLVHQGQDAPQNKIVDFQTAKYGTTAIRQTNHYRHPHPHYHHQHHHRQQLSLHRIQLGKSMYVNTKSFTLNIFSASTSGIHFNFSKKMSLFSRLGQTSENRLHCQHQNHQFHQRKV